MVPCNKLLDKLDKITGGNFFSSLKSIFSEMELAERMIARGMKKFPDHKDLVYDCFMIVQPTAALRSTWMGPEIPELAYQAHCFELFKRVINGHDTRIATSAEMLCALSQVSFKQPLNPRYAHVYGRLFVDVFGINAVEDLFPDQCLDDYTKSLKQSVFFVEEYKGAYDEAVSVIINRLHQPERVYIPFEERLEQYRKEYSPPVQSPIQLELLPA